MDDRVAGTVPGDRADNGLGVACCAPSVPLIQSFAISPRGTDACLGWRCFIYGRRPPLSAFISSR